MLEVTWAWITLDTAALDLANTVAVDKGVAHDLLAPAGDYQEAEEARTWRLRADVGVQGVAAQQQSPAGPLELLLGQPTHRQQRKPGQAQQLPRRQAGGQPEGGPHRREQREQPLEDRPADASPATDQLLPGRPVAGGRRPPATPRSRLGRGTAPRSGHRRGGGRPPGGVHPLQAVALQLQPTQDR
jgi:hypothetical protein